MRIRRTTTAALSAAGLTAALVGLPGAATAAPATGAATAAGASAARTGTQEYVVLVKAGASRAAAARAVRRAGGRVVGANPAIGALRVVGPATGFATAVGRSAAVEGAAANARIGRSPDARARVRAKVDAVEHEARLGGATASRRPTAARPSRAGMDPLDDRLWGLRMVRSDLAREVQAGDRRVRVGILDTGIDARNPDLAPNVDRRLSRNFAPDLPEVDNPPGEQCEFRGCVDPADWDDNGHGTHVAGTIGAAANGSGLSGVAPGVRLVNIRGGQDSGYFFLGPVTDALTYAGDVGLDVVNMSFYVDPWLYNCRSNPADSPEAQAQQRTIIKAMKRALRYAHRKGVTLVGALGNDYDDLGSPRTDVSSPDFPPDAAYPRPVDNATCLDLPVEGPHVLGVSALGPSGRKADYSNYGTEQTDLSAPGGWYRDYVGTPRFRTNENLILSSYPVNALRDEGLVDEAGDVTPAGVAEGVLKDCTADGRCGYYAWLQGTSMAAPHASGVAALVVSEYGRHRRGGFGMAPDRVRRVLYRSAQDRACPDPRTVDYLREGRTAEWTATCAGDREDNGFYGNGIVDAYRAVTIGRR